MWKSIKEYVPPQNVILNTKIHNEQGVRNEQNLILNGKLWFTPDMKMYVYYTPTHWDWDYSKL